MFVLGFYEDEDMNLTIHEYYFIKMSTNVSGPDSECLIPQNSCEKQNCFNLKKFNSSVSRFPYNFTLF